MNFCLGIKKEMTQLFEEDGNVVPCTIIDVSDVRIVGERTEERDGYRAVILGLGKKRKPTKAEEGTFKDLKYVPQYVFEFRLEETKEKSGFKIGEEVNIETFKPGDKVKVTGKTKGKGFQGVVKRWGFKGWRKTHGNSDKLRAPGSIGGGTTPGRVYKGKKMPGQMGMKTKSVLNLEIVKADSKNRLLCLKGGVPGARNGILRITKQ